MNGIESLIPALNPRSNLRQLFQFVVDGTKLMSFSQITAAEMYDLLRTRADRFNVGLREYIIQMLPGIARASFRAHGREEIEPVGT